MNKPYTCTSCNEPCYGEVVDFGIGPFEYFGMKGYNSDKHFVSDCCEAKMVDYSGDKVYNDGNDYWED